MDTEGRLRYRKRQQGSMLVLIAFAIVVLIAMTGLVVDLGYMYSVKAKLQNAADAGALAGAGRITRQSTLANYTGARNGAKQFADINFNLTLDTNAATNNPDGDIVLGFWNHTSFHPSANPVNAVKVVARRTGDPADAAAGIGANSIVDLFLGKILGINTMGTKSSAIAYRPPRARTFFLLGRNTCNTNSFPLILSPTSANMAWTSLMQPSSNANDIRNNFFCPADALPFEEVCGRSVYTTNGIDSSVFKAVEVDFYDPLYDAAPGIKTFVDSNHTIVETWKVIAPVAFVDDPSTQPSPQPVWGYAEIVMTRACGTGGGNPCPGRSFNAPAGVCSGGENDVVIRSISCTDCASSPTLPGALPILAK